MTFENAKKKLKKIAKGEYRHIKYALKDDGKGNETPTCTLYIDGYCHHEGLTWADAFKSLDREINGHITDTNEQPKGNENG